MENRQTVCLLNDSFPPQIDGVANAVVNYARQLEGGPFSPMVITPACSGAEDDAFPYPVLRYPSIQTQRFEGYSAGIPFSPEIVRAVSASNVAILHTHCPIASTFMARKLRQLTGAPIVFTYHTKFDVDIETVIRAKPVQLAAKKALAANISACDEVWAVSRGAGENLRALGYEGDYIVMPNGVDMPCEPVKPELIQAATADWDLPQDVPVYLFVGRMMWYKGLRIVLDALARQQAQGRDFRMVLIGDGEDRPEIEAYARQCGVFPKCCFVGAVRDRELLRGWYAGADLFLFASTFDTNGLVVREAAACGLASVLIRGSCAAEDVTDGRNCFLIREDADSLSACLSSLSTQQMRLAGAAAGRELYLSWKSAVKAAAERYSFLLERHAAGELRHRRKPVEEALKINAELMEALAKLSDLRHRAEP